MERSKELPRFITNCILSRRVKKKKICRWSTQNQYIKVKIGRELNFTLAIREPKGKEVCSSLHGSYLPSSCLISAGQASAISS